MQRSQISFSSGQENHNKMTMSAKESNLATAKSILSTVGTIAATAMVVRTVTHDYLPPEFQDYLFSGIRSFFSRFSNQITMVIDEFDGLINNELYEAVEVYLGAKASPNMKRLNVSKPDKEKAINVKLETNEELADVYAGVKLKWALVSRTVESKSFYNSRDMNATLRSEIRSFELSLGKKHKHLVLESYFPYILEQAKSIKSEKKTTKLFTVDYNNMYNPGDAWTGVNLNHPANFETLAMDPELKSTIMADLDLFVSRREYYRQVGKAWKRGYLLFGPPGTGKSSLIAAMANYLNFDIYDLELTELRANSELRRLLVATANRSILVVEDIDCTIDLQDRAATDQISNHRQQEEKVTLSGLLNFVDGLWSSCGDERIIIFTTNHKEKLDPALLRPGRMDVHIHMSYCTPSGFRLLASNYLGVKSHKLFSEIEKMLESTKVTPAEIAEQLLKNVDAKLALSGLVGFLDQKRNEDEADKAKKVLEDLESVAQEHKTELKN